MAKTYIDIVKYMVEAKFEISGVVEKPDIIGAVFGQTEGLLGADLDLRELQKNGKIGRIEIEVSSGKNKTAGTLVLPSSLGRVETCILAAAIEAVDRVGPFDTSFSVIKIDDTRNEKRNRVINRAKELVKKMLNTTIPDSKEISEIVEAEVKSSIVGTYGEDKLPAGPDIAKNDEVILVEGRADVINLLRNDITNCIAIGGASGHVPRSIIELCKQKDVTVFLDGDRGGDIILNGLMAMNAEVDFVCRAPDGKEVEELTRKEIIRSMRFRVPADQALAASKSRRDDAYSRPSRNGRNHFRDYEDQKERVRDRELTGEPGNEEKREEERSMYKGRPRDEPEISSPSKIVENLRGKPNAEQPTEQFSSGARRVEIKEEVESVDFGSSDAHASIGDAPAHDKLYMEGLDELKNTLRGRIYSKDGTVISEVPIRELIHAIDEAKGAYAIVFDGIVTQRLTDIADRNGIKAIYGVRPSEITRKHEGLFLFTSENGVL